MANPQQYLLHPAADHADDSEAKVVLIRSKDNPIMNCFYESCFYRRDYVICDTEYALPYTEFFSFTSTDRELRKLGATLTMEIAGQKFTTDQNCVIEVPAFVPHGHITLTDMTSPVFSYVMGPGREHASLPKASWHPENLGVLDEIVRYYNGDTVKLGPEGVQDYLIRCSPGKTIRGDVSGTSRRLYESDRWVLAPECHIHDTPEVLGYFGADPWHPFELGATFTQSINGEKVVIDRPSIVYLPPYIPHCPLIVEKVEKDTFWHSVGLNTGFTDGHPEWNLKELGVVNDEIQEFIPAEPW